MISFKEEAEQLIRDCHGDVKYAQSVHIDPNSVAIICVLMDIREELRQLNGKSTVNMNGDECCENCVFFVNGEECHRYPIGQAFQGNFETWWEWRKVHKTDVCGEHQRKEDRE